MQQLVRNIFFVKFKAISEVIILIENRKEPTAFKGKNSGIQFQLFQLLLISKEKTEVKFLLQKTHSASNTQYF